MTNTIDPMGGSHYLESLTDELEKQCFEIIKQVDQRGGATKAWQWIQKAHLSSAYEKQKRIENGEQTIVGLNAFTIDEDAEPEMDLFEIDPLKEIKNKRDHGRVEKTLDDVSRTSEKGQNTMRAMAEPYKVMATLGEVRHAWERGVGLEART